MNDGKDVDEGSPQVMLMFVYYISFVHVLNPRKNKKKRSYNDYKTYWIIVLKKKVDVDHVLTVKIFEEEINGPIKETLEKQPTRKDLMCQKCNI